MGIEEQIKEKGRAYVIESLKTKIRFYNKRRIAIEETIAIARNRLEQIENEVIHMNGLLQEAEEYECTSK